jgi:cytochrome P450
LTDPAAHGGDRSWGQTFDEREKAFARLRADGGLTWHEPVGSGFPGGEPSIWAVTRHEDIDAISRDHEVFSSAGRQRLPAGAERKTSVFLVMDPSEHISIRRLISAAFTPKVARIQAQIEADARDIGDGFVGAGEIDFVSSCSAVLPMRTVSDMIGIASPDREVVTRAAEVLFAGPSEENLASGVDRMAVVRRQVGILCEAAIEIARDRWRRPKDDLMTNIVQAEVDGRRLTDQEIGALMVLPSTAGNDTTKQITSHTVLALARHPRAEGVAAG